MTEPSPVRWHLLTCEYPPAVGGISDHTAQMAAALAARGDDVHVWCPGPAREPEPGVQLHPVLGGFSTADLARVGAALDAYPAPRRLVVQWVPHGYGRRSMNLGFCVWLAARARRGDEVDLVVHEPFMEWWTGSLRHVAVAAVHRLMTVLLLRSARLVWLSTPAWEPLLRPYALGRRVEMRWLPVPGCEGPTATAATNEDEPRETVPDVDARRPVPVVGHFGSFSPLVCPLLEERLAGVMASATCPTIRLIGQGSDRFARLLLDRHPAWAGRVEAVGLVPADRLPPELRACDVMVQPYPDGITTRRTSAMAALAQGRAVVSTRGRLTEPLWDRLAAAELVAVADVAAFVATTEALLADSARRHALGTRASAVYQATFSTRRLADALRAA